ncbi:alpha/beta hydrolase [Actinoplanes sp. NEAU-A12]|uniref:Alpha/beta hydrolase n=1 Tax=Actinoplanes sandaracinus TaxID=3045177 RepID=A0ABT6WHR0_9ACTN|nr:alpha/beta hydrolase [Actinoplanes sandaracinus]MDI6099247.1 alpha/beta hydrolase [Actinoplanes sandaracinus]
MDWHRVADSVHGGERITVHRGPGTGPALVLAHGMEDSWLSWEPLIAGLHGRFTPYALDLPWRPGGDYAWRADPGPAALLAAAVALVPQPVTVLAGHSYGAGAVLELLAFGFTPTAAVLVAPHYRPPGDEDGPELVARESARFAGVIAEGVRLRLGPRATTLDPGLVETMIGKTLDRIGPGGVQALLHQFLVCSRLPLGDVRVPTLVITGSADPALAGPRTTALRAAMPAATIHTRPGAGHFIHVQDSDRVGAEIRAFLDTVRVPTA